MKTIEQRTRWLAVVLSLGLTLHSLSSQAQVRFNQFVPMSSKHSSVMMNAREGKPIDVEHRVVRLSPEQEVSRSELSEDVVALAIEVDWGLHNAGTWQEVGNLGRVWRLEIDAKDASGLNFMFSEFVIPEGASLAIYNEDQSLIMGPFTSVHNKPYHRFTTHQFGSSTATLEYFEPTDKKGQGMLHIERVGYGVLDMFDSIDPSASSRSGGNFPPPKTTQPDFDCTVNANCSQGDGLDPLKRAVCHILEWKPSLNQWIGFTGTLINNGAEDCDPLVLTAGHQVPPSPSVMVNDHYVFRYNFLRTGCSGTGVDWNEVVDYCGAEWVYNANTGLVEHDLGLMRMETLPAYKEYYAGWSNDDFWERQSMYPEVRILSQPAGNPMKVYLPKDTLPAYPYGSGLTWSFDPASGYRSYGGSSGSPFINRFLRIQSVQVKTMSEGCQTDVIEGPSLHHLWDRPDDNSPLLSSILNPGGAIPEVNGVIRLDGRERYEMCGITSRCLHGLVDPQFTVLTDNCEYTLTDNTVIPPGYEAVGRQWDFNDNPWPIQTEPSITLQGIGGSLNVACLTVFLRHIASGEICAYQSCQTLGCSGNEVPPPPCVNPQFPDPLFFFTVGEACNLNFSSNLGNDPNIVATEWTFDGHRLWNSDEMAYQFFGGWTFPYHEVCLTVYWRDPISWNLCSFTECRFVNCSGGEPELPPVGWKREEVVYPNPVYLPDALMIQHQADHQGEVTVVLIDMQGRTISQTLHPVIAGDNQIRLETSQWPVGIYNLQILEQGAPLHQQQVIILE